MTENNPIPPPSISVSNSTVDSYDVVEPLVLYVDKVEILRLDQIKILESSFYAQVWISLVIPNGALDEHLSKKGVHFPIDENGIPTFTPSALWYGEQLEFANTHKAPRRIELTVVRKGDDLYLNSRWEGDFHEEYELHDFPFDKQALTLTFSINSRTRGRLPVTFKLDRVQPSIVRAGFAQKNQYYLNPNLFLRTHEIGADEERMFPAISFACIVTRRPTYFTMNATIPFGFFSLLSLFQFAVQPVPHGSFEPVQQQGRVDMAAINHRSQLSLMLVLTASAYKMAISGRLPGISCECTAAHLGSERLLATCCLTVLSSPARACFWQT